MSDKLNNKLTPSKIETISNLINTKRISDLDTIQVYNNDNDTITVSDEFINSYLLTSTYINNNYYDYRVKLHEVSDYLAASTSIQMQEFRNIFEFFISCLKSNTENAYVQFAPVSDTINIEDPKQNYSYTLNLALSEIKEEYTGFSDDSNQYTNTFTYTNKLTDGLITANILEEYVRETIGRILGVPATPAYVSAAIDSVIEFVDWFKGYVKDDTSYGSLQNLITTIENKDANIKNLAYAYADKIKNLSYIYADKIKTLSYAYTGKVAEETKNLSYAYTAYIKELSYSYSYDLHNQTYTYIIDKLNDYDPPMIGISDENKIRVGNVTYVLEIDNDKKLKLTVDIDNYTPITLNNVTSNITNNLEYNTAIGNGSVNVSATASKNCNSSGWIAGSNTTVTDNAVNNLIYTAKISYAEISTDTTYTCNITATEILTESDRSHGHTTAASATAAFQLKYNFNKYKVFVFADANSSITDIISSKFNSGNPSQPAIISSNGKTNTVSSIGVNLVGSFMTISQGYLYFVLPKSFVSNTKSIKWTGGEAMGDTPGSARKSEFQLYNSTVNYIIFRSEQVYPSGTAVNLKYE